MLRSLSKDTKSQRAHRQVEENISRYWADLGAEMHFSIEKTQLFTGIHHPMFNGVLRSNIPSTIASKRVSEIIEQFRKRGLPFRWIVHERSKPGNLRSLLTEKGLSRADSWCGLFHNLEGVSRYPQESQSITIQPITSHDAMMIWAANFAESVDISFKEAKKYADLLTRQGVKPYRHFIASHDGICNGVASLYFFSNVIGIYNLTVKKSARGQGVGHAIVNYLLTHAKKIGAEGVVLHVPSQMKEGYVHLGFNHVVNLEIFESTY